MRIKAQPKWKWAAGIGAGLLLILLSVAAAGREEQTVGAFATGENEYTVRGALLMEAMDKVGVYSPEEAAQVWAQGVMQRSAALQYAVMTDELKSQYARRLETTAPNWVTGVSNPWIMGYEVVGRENVSATCRKFRLSFTTATSAGTAGTHTAVLVIVQEENFWRVQQIFTGEGLYPYTRF